MRTERMRWRESIQLLLRRQELLGKKLKGTRKNVTLFVDESLYDEAKGLGIPVSRLLEETLEDAIEKPGMSKEELEMRRKLRQQKQLTFQRDLLLDEINDIEEQLKELGVDIQQSEKLAVRARTSEERGKVIQALNQVIKGFGYDEKICWHNDTVRNMLEKLSTIDKKEWNMEVFMEHINRLKRLTRFSG